MDLLVDPVVFALPSSPATAEEVVSYVHYLSQWSKDFYAGEYNFMVSESCVFALNDAGRYPYLEKLQRLWQYAGEDALGCTDVFNACIKVLTNMPYLEDRIPELEAIVIDEQSVRVRPDLLERQAEMVTYAFQETLGYLAYAKFSIPESVAVDMLLVTYPIEGGPQAEISADVLVETEELMVNADVLLITSPDDLLDLYDLAASWQDTPRTIQHVLQKMIREGMVTKESKLASYSMASQFNKSISQYHCDRRPDLLNQIFRKCVLLLTNQLPIDAERHKPLGKPNQHQLGQWKAWRLHVTGSPLGLRLHYWRRNNEYYLMQVKPHEDFDIEVPDELYN